MIKKMMTLFFIKKWYWKKTMDFSKLIHYVSIKQSTLKRLNKSCEEMQSFLNEQRLILEHNQLVTEHSNISSDW